MSKRKIALFGGSFDPIHTDHLNIAKTCHEQLGFAEVWLLPAYLNPFKKNEYSTINDRLAMLEIVVQQHSFLKLNDYEINNHRPTYTYETIQYLTTKYPDYEFSFIMGSDQLDRFEQWRDFDKLIQMLPFKVFLRDAQNYNREIVQKYRLEVFNFANNHLSSTMIRNLEKLELQIPTINDYCNNHLLYLRERLESQMDQKRYYHCLNVGMLAKQLAAAHGVDEQKAWIAGTLHDVTKCWTQQKAASYLQDHPALMAEPPQVWHSFTGAFHLQKDWLLNDQEILQAVFKHTVGAPEMSLLEMVVFCADKVSVERNYPEVATLRELCFQDLHAGFQQLLINQYTQAILKHGANQIGSLLQKTYRYWIEGVKE